MLYGFCWTHVFTDVSGFALCEEKGWHLASVIHALVDKGFSYRDAEAFADYAFTLVAVVSDYGPKECLTAAQAARVETL